MRIIVSGVTQTEHTHTAIWMNFTIHIRNVESASWDKEKAALSLFHACATWMKETTEMKADSYTAQRPLHKGMIAVIFMLQSCSYGGIKMPIGFIFWSLASLVLIFRGICARKSEGPVRFFTVYRAPWVYDIKKYNNAISVLSIVGGIVLEILGIPLLRKSSSYLLVVTIAAGIWIIILTVIYEIIEKKYKVR